MERQEMNTPKNEAEMQDYIRQLEADNAALVRHLWRANEIISAMHDMDDGFYSGSEPPELQEIRQALSTDHPGAKLLACRDALEIISRYPGIREYVGTNLHDRALAALDGKENDDACVS